jgi:hypothetical protein
VIDPENSTHKVDFYEMSGMVELANSVFWLMCISLYAWFF